MAEGPPDQPPAGCRVRVTRPRLWERRASLRPGWLQFYSLPHRGWLYSPAAVLTRVRFPRFAGYAGKARCGVHRKFIITRREWSARGRRAASWRTATVPSARAGGDRDVGVLRDPGGRDP